MTIVLDESEIKNIEKRVLDDLSLYIKRTIKDELRKILSAKKKEQEKSQFDFL